MPETAIRLESMQEKQPQALIELLSFAFRDHFKQCQN